MERILDRADVGNTVNYMVLADDRVVFDSEGLCYGTSYDDGWLQGEGNVFTDAAGKRWYVGSIRNAGREFTCLYMYPWLQGFLWAMADTPMLLGLLVAFTAMALVLYIVSSRRIFRRVKQINEGLTVIGQNHLDHRLLISSVSDEFDEISKSINVMTEMLQTAVDEEYEMRLKHMHLQLTQIQARFNPHFLYNTLEMIRGRLFESGDLESVDYIEKLARIFRNLTDAKSVIKLRDELSFCSLYVALLQLRSSGDVNVSYDVSPELLDCGIIANLIQPAIENYFVHALDDERESKELEIICQPKGESDVQIIVADNGTGITTGRMTEVNRQLATPDLAVSHYGLMSIAKRIKLFYGDPYGVHLEQNPAAGVRVVIDIPRMSMKEHESKLMPTKYGGTCR
ncbi:MAG: histidine kinase [Clostridia bacterium]|nr:histidine kinase [Clostridia bacterium]